MTADLLDSSCDWRPPAIASLTKAADRRAAMLLRELIMDISEDAICSSWDRDIEFALWRIVHEGADPLYFRAHVTGAIQAELWLGSERAGGWWTWREEPEPGEVFVTFDEWRALVAQKASER